MKKRILAVFLALGMLTCLLSACGGATNQTSKSSDETSASSGQNSVDSEQNHANEITVGIAQDLDDSLDPYQMTAAGTREVMFNVFEGLVKPDSDGNFVDAVASEHSVSDDQLTYTFTLRDGVVFHNGAECTVDDVLYSFETCAATTVNSAVAEALSAIVDTKTEGNQISFTLSAPNSDFISYVSNVYIVPKDYAEQATQPVGTGPFKYVSRSVQENVVLEKNADYYGEQAKLDKVTYKIFEDNTAMMTALNAGGLDLVAHLTSDQVNTLTNGYDVLEGTMNLVQAVYLNNAVAPFDNQQVRQALCYAIDRQSIMDMIADGHGTALGSSIYPAFTKYFLPELVQKYPYDPAKAKELLAQAGYPNGFDMTISVPSNYQPHMDTAEVVAEQLRAVGVNVTIQPMEWGVWHEQVYKGRDFQATLVGLDASAMTARALLERFTSDHAKNFVNYNNPDYDALFTQAMNASDDTQQAEIYKQMETMLSDTAANLYIQDLADLVAMRQNLAGLEFYPIYVLDLSTVHFVK